MKHLDVTCAKWKKKNSKIVKCVQIHLPTLNHIITQTKNISLYFQDKKIQNPYSWFF
jgi:hypothetical protein